MGASRDLTLSVFVEATLVLALAVAALVAGTTDLRGMVAATAGTGVWSSPALALGAVAFALVVDRRDRAPAGRQPRHPPRADDDPRGAAARVRAAATSPTCSGPPRHGTGSCSCSPPRSSCPTRAASWWQLALLPRRPRRAVRRARADRDARREDARPARAAAARRRRASWRCSGSSPGWWGAR